MTALPNAGLSKYLAQDGFYGALRRSKLNGDCRVGQTIENSFEDLPFAFRQQAVQVAALPFRDRAG